MLGGLIVCRKHTVYFLFLAAGGVGSAITAYKPSATPAMPMPLAKRPGQIGRSASSHWLTTVPKTIIRKAIVIGAQTGPHHGSGMRNRMSQSRSDLGKPVRARRKT